MLKRKLARPGKITQVFLWLLAPSMAYLVHASAFAQSPAQGNGALYVAAVSTHSLSASSGNYDALLLEPDAPKIGLQPQAKGFVHKYLAKSKKDLLFIARQRQAQFKMIESIFEKQGLPLEMKYLAMVESDLKANAVSKAGAVGMWQLMPQTARNFGLKVSHKTDERRNAYKSTVAAAKYLKCLYREYNDWLLVVAAYNSGSGRVQSAIKKSGSKSFWALQRFLPAETRGHVQHFISVHYLLEEKGSVVTLTRAEVKKHSQMISDYLSKKTCDLEVLTTTENVAVAAPGMTTETK